MNIKLIKNHIESLKNRTDLEWRPYGGGNPYSYCKECEQSNVQGHQKNCSWVTQKELVLSLEELVLKVK